MYSIKTNYGFTNSIHLFIIAALGSWWWNKIGSKEMIEHLLIQCFHFFHLGQFKTIQTDCSQTTRISEVDCWIFSRKCFVLFLLKIPFRPLHTKPYFLRMTFKAPSHYIMTLMCLEWWRDYHDKITRFYDFQSHNIPIRSTEVKHLYFLLPRELFRSDMTLTNR